MKKQFLIILALVLSFSACSSAPENTQTESTQPKSTQTETPPIIIEESHEPIMVTVKYKDELVDIALFEELDTSKSSFIQGAWYDTENEYMIIKLNGTNYQYCNLPTDIWENFKQASSFGSFYNSTIKGNYACE